MLEAANTFRWRLLVVAIALGLVVPAVPVAGDDCSTAPRPAAASCDTGGDTADSCCPVEEDRHDDEDEDGNCCPGGCDCVCCGCATTTPVEHRPAPARASLVPPSSSLVDGRSALTPQVSTNPLLRPPQS